MYKSVWEFVRPSVETAFPAGNSALNAVREIAAGYIGKEVTFENNRLTKKLKTVWASEEDAMNFMQANTEIIAQANADLMSYCETNGITATRTIE